MGNEWPSNEQKEKSSVFKKFSELKGALVEQKQAENLKGLDVFSLKVVDQKKWGSKEGMNKLVETFGPLAFDAFEPRKGNKEYDPNDPEMLTGAQDSVESNIKPADRMYVIADQDQVKGFISLECWPLKDGTKAMYVHLVSVDRESQNQGLNKELYRLAFTEAEISAFLGISFRPEAVKNRLAIGEEFGYTGFYAGNKNGEWGNLGTEEERERIEELNNLMLKKSEEWDILVDKETPPGYAIWQGDSTLSPLLAEEVKFSENDPLKEVFQKGVLKLQKECAPDVAFGILINLKEKQLDS